MFIGYFTERPYQDQESGYFGSTGRDIADLGISNSEYNPKLGSELYNRYLDEKVYAEEMGFDGVMLNEHHSTPFCMGGVVNVEAAILSRITQRVSYPGTASAGTTVLDADPAGDAATEVRALSAELKHKLI